jgi:hypothetical protein
MAREFTAYVVLRDPKSKQSVTFEPGDVVPEWANVGDHAASQGVTRARQTPDDAPANDVTPVIEEDATEIVTPEYEEDATEIVTPEYEEDEEALPPYEEWSKTDLRAEVDGRELDVAKKATVAELVEALQADDLAHEEEEE